MALNDIRIVYPLENSEGTIRRNVAANATQIYPGDPVAEVPGATTVTVMATNKPVVLTDYLAGIASSLSTQTTSLAGFVDVIPLTVNTVYAIKPKVAATFDTQAKYDALVGKRVLIDLTAGTYTILADDGDTYGCVIEPCNIAERPGTVLFSFRDTVNVTN